jgi:polygalacturonase
MRFLFFICAMVLNLAVCRAGTLPANSSSGKQHSSSGKQHIFNVRALGAVGDGVNPDTAAIQAALDACDQAGGGIVEIPAGTYLSQPLIIHSKTVFQIDSGAILQASTNQMDFMKTPGDWLKAKGSGDFIPFIGGKDLTERDDRRRRRD